MVLCNDGSFQASTPQFGRSCSSIFASVFLLLSVFVAGTMGTCTTAEDCYPNVVDPALVRCIAGRNVCVCNECFDISAETQRCFLIDGCWKIEGDMCIDKNDQRQHFPLMVSLYATSGLSIVLLLLVTILMKCALHKPEMRDFLNTRKKIDSIVALLFTVGMVSTLVFIGSIAGSLALLFSTDFDVEDYFGRCIGSI